MDFPALAKGIRETGVSVTPAELKAEYDKLDLDKITAEQEARFELKEWEGEPIGSLSTEAQVREHFNLSLDDKAYRGYIDGKPVYFQYHQPFVAGMVKLNASNIVQIMSGHKSRLVERAVGSEVARILTEHFTLPGA